MRAAFARCFDLFGIETMGQSAYQMALDAVMKDLAVPFLMLARNAAVKERSQLHRIIAQNCWLFGEEFGLSVDDRSLTEVLIAHKKMLDPDIVIDAPVKHISQTRGIVDLMLSSHPARTAMRTSKIVNFIANLPYSKVQFFGVELVMLLPSRSCLAAAACCASRSAITCARVAAAVACAANMPRICKSWFVCALASWFAACRACIWPCALVACDCN